MPSTASVRAPDRHTSFLFVHFSLYCRFHPPPRTPMIMITITIHNGGCSNTQCYNNDRRFLVAPITRHEAGALRELPARSPVYQKRLQGRKKALGAIFIRRSKRLSAAEAPSPAEKKKLPRNSHACRADQPTAGGKSSMKSMSSFILEPEGTQRSTQWIVQESPEHCRHSMTCGLQQRCDLTLRQRGAQKDRSRIDRRDVPRQGKPRARCTHLKIGSVQFAASVRHQFLY